ncbi:hypothetical protein J2Q11_12160 [Tenacibaculum finnmarkense genomovar finnmarkense]|uniref:hypothetical protein n=1 Tax=Tenacibaculum finnmarkense TaxID=2781243 RepID=UPI001E52ED1F|nr:hypothetical protein [Tenacibaculum finnmarkense]MCD8418337.1 hypothetical protein [Tenacibaculum finnmarkense genomovar finnmarkense]MCG8186776.1 hypothetical protein [Tenacibaculum finnmarkense genomovar finnmarkense]MCG8203290.1 hypothetical protein [Tenacibaculum finnmarkense genomovar finnmarkense]MCG8210761.1 hypothetical protein [Tenacibaculum finnmarkense genomovar finnmarkense]MCG8213570.1 hypothetical protein [Tenacibaculum finnmarkense genomovar finnmarkense]
MKYNFIYIVILISLLACNIPRKFIKNDNICNPNYITEKEIFILDTTLLKNIKITYTPKIFYEDKKTKKEIVIYSDDLIVVYLHDKINETSKWKYYKNLKLQKRREVFRLKNDDSFNYLYINQACFFDKKGNVIKTIDYRQKNKYQICFKEAYNIVKKKKPKNYVINHMERDFIIKEKDTIYTWNVHIKHLGTPKRKSFLYTINAKNGKEIKKVQTIVIHP